MGQTLLGLILALASVFLILLVLVQRGRGGGLAGALGGPGGQSAFGAKAGDVFTYITIWTVSIWILLCMSMLWWIGCQDSNPIDEDLGGAAGASTALPQNTGDLLSPQGTTATPGVTPPVGEAPNGTDPPVTGDTPVGDTPTGDAPAAPGDTPTTDGGGAAAPPADNTTPDAGGPEAPAPTGDGAATPEESDSQ
jgi:preprotein translocase subunit SecG